MSTLLILLTTVIYCTYAYSEKLTNKKNYVCIIKLRNREKKGDGNNLSRKVTPRYINYTYNVVRIGTATNHVVSRETKCHPALLSVTYATQTLFGHGLSHFSLIKFS